MAVAVGVMIDFWSGALELDEAKDGWSLILVVDADRGEGEEWRCVAVLDEVDWGVGINKPGGAKRRRPGGAGRPSFVRGDIVVVSARTPCRSAVLSVSS